MKKTSFTLNNIPSTILNKLRVPASSRPVALTSSGYPGVVKDDYFDVWEEFIRTKVVKDISSEFSTFETRNSYIVGSFISHLVSEGGKSIFNSGMRIDVPSLYVPMTKAFVRQVALGINDRFRKYGLTKNFTLSRNKFSIGYSEVSFIKALSSIEVAGNLVFSLNSRLPMGQALALLVGGMYSQIPEKLAGSNIKHLSQEHLLLKASSLTKFHPMVNSAPLSIHVARSLSDSLVFKYKVEIPILAFYSSGKMQKTIKDIESFWKSALLT